MVKNNNNAVYGIYPSLEDRVVVISGGSAGIGAAMVNAFAEQGSKVAFLDIDTERAATLKSKLDFTSKNEPYFIECDVRNIEQLQKSIKKISKTLGRIHTLINNAGGNDRKPVNDIEIEDWENFQSLNIRHVLFASQVAFSAMKELKDGSIINFTSPTSIPRLL